MARPIAHYLVVFVDYHTRFRFVYLIFHKSKAFGCFRCFINLVENPTDKPKNFSEYLSDSFKKLCEKNIRQLTILGTSQQDNLAEQRNGTDMVRLMMAQTYLPISL